MPPTSESRDGAVALATLRHYWQPKKNAATGLTYYVCAACKGASHMCTDPGGLCEARVRSALDRAHNAAVEAARTRLLDLANAASQAATAALPGEAASTSDLRAWAAAYTAAGADLVTLKRKE